MNKELNQFFKSLPRGKGSALINPELKKYETFSSLEEEQRYLEDYLEMAEKGLFSFDKTNVGDFSDLSYHLVFMPKKGIHFSDLPEDVKLLLKKTQIDQSVLIRSSVLIKD